MTEFKEVYQTALHDTRKFHIDAADCLNRGRHKARIWRQAYRTTASLAAAASLLLLVGVGTVSAAGYLQNLIVVNESGFQSADAGIRLDGKQSRNLARGIEESGSEDTAPILEGAPAQMMEAAPAGESAIEQTETAPITDAAVEADVSEEKETVRGETSIAADEALPAADDSMKKASAETASVQPETQSDEAGIMMASEVPFREYGTMEEFRSKESVILPMPAVLGDSITGISIRVSDSWALVSCQLDSKSFWMERTDYSKTEGHASSKVFPGGVTNERTYQSGSYQYTLVDSVKQTEEEPLQIHAAISVGSYEVYLDFSGFTEKEAKAVIDSLDIKQYETVQAKQE